MSRFNYDAGAQQHQLLSEEDGAQDLGAEDEYDDEEFERHNTDNENVARYILKCQHAKRVYSGNEIDDFELRRRNETGMNKF